MVPHQTAFWNGSGLGAADIFPAGNVLFQPDHDVRGAGLRGLDRRLVVIDATDISEALECR